MCCELQKQYSNRNESLCSISAVFLHMFTTPTDKYTYIHTYIHTHTVVADLISGSISQLNTPGKTVFRQLLVSIPKEMTGGYLYCQVMRTSLPSFDINRYSRLDIAFLNLVLPPSSLLFPSVSFVCCFSSHLISSSLCIYLVCSTYLQFPSMFSHPHPP